MKIASLSVALFAITLMGTVDAFAAEDSSPRDASARRDAASVLIDQSWEADSPVHFAVTTGEADVNLPEACRDCCQDSCRTCEPLWTFQAGTIFLERSNPSGAVLAITFDAQPLLNASSFNFDMQTGWDIGAQRRLNDQHSLDFRYFQVDGWNDSIVSAPTTFSFVPFQNTGAGVGFPHVVSAYYGSLLRSAELNILRDQNECLTLLPGFR
ncbi:MAG: hypothetical protein ACKO38_12115, partial [Planctomycetota bacterium]